MPAMQGQQPPTVEPTGGQIKTWGAIPGFDATGEVGTAVGKFSESDAREAMIRQYALGGEGDCKVDLTYRNQCAAFEISGNEAFF
ncbi:DUF4189 domain-containing protein [Xanthomonas prunicola]|nr:DUF4189 domain-containing protein [Xanthomonas prunicola]